MQFLSVMAYMWQGKVCVSKYSVAKNISLGNLDTSADIDIEDPDHVMS